MKKICMILTLLLGFGTRASVFTIAFGTGASVSCLPGDTLSFTSNGTALVYINTVYIGNSHNQIPLSYIVLAGDTMYSEAWQQGGVQPTCGGRICTNGGTCPPMAFAINELAAPNLMIPNPVKNVLSVNGNTNATLLQLFNAEGQAVLCEKIQPAQNLLIDVHELPRGLYLLVLSGNTPVSRKIVLE